MTNHQMVSIRFGRALALALGLIVQLGCNSTQVAQQHSSPLTGPSIQKRSAPSGSTDWFSNAGYGVMVHWTSQSRPQSGAAPSAYCNAVNAFNVAAFAQQLREAGAGYVIFTISHAQQYFAFPSAKLDSIIPGRTCGRDLYADLFNAINPKGIRMIFYFPSIGTDEDPAWRDASHFNSDPANFAQRQYDLVEEIGNRYGEKLAGWWVDNAFDGGYNARYNLTTYANKLRAGNPNRLVSFNLRGTAAWTSSTASGIADYQAGEADDLIRLPSARFSGEGGTQWHTLVYMDDFWVHNNPGTPTPRFSNGEVAGHIRNVMDNQGVFSFNAAPYQDSLISGATMNQLRAVNASVHDLKVDDTDANIVYSGGWGATSGANYANSTGHHTLSTGSQAQYNFSGTGVKWYGVVGNDHGRADVYIDNQLDSTVDLYAPNWAANTVVYAKRGLTNGPHSLKIVARADKNAASSDRYLEIDGLEAIIQNDKIDDRNPQVTYSGGWSTISAAGYYLGTGTFSTTPGSQAQYSFSGTGINWYGVTGTDHGKADVFIDDVLDSTVDLYSTARATGLVYSKGGLTGGAHTIKIVVRSDRNANATANYVEVDALELGGTSATKLDDRAPQVSYVGGWSQIAGGNYFANTGTFTTTAGLEMQLSFAGSSIRWYGVTGTDHGKADVYIDNVLDSTVDLYSATRTTGSVYARSGLSSGSHSIRIVVRSDRNPSASDNYVEVDALEYQ